jgi:hypothetical protein
LVVSDVSSNYVVPDPGLGYPFPFRNDGLAFKAGTMTLHEARRRAFNWQVRASLKLAAAYSGKRLTVVQEGWTLENA